MTIWHYHCHHHHHRPNHDDPHYQDQTHPRHHRHHRHIRCHQRSTCHNPRSPGLAGGEHGRHDEGPGWSGASFPCHPQHRVGVKGGGGGGGGGGNRDGLVQCPSNPWARGLQHRNRTCKSRRPLKARKNCPEPSRKEKRGKAGEF